MTIQATYDQVAADYQSFYGSDLYSIAEDRAIAAFILEASATSRGLRPQRVADIGCGAGLPRVIWDALFARYDPGDLDYEGFDLSPGMIEQARHAYADEIRDGCARFHAAGATQILPRLAADDRALVLSLHGVLSHIAAAELPRALAGIARITRGHAVLSFLGRYADCRAPEHPRRALYTCRQLPSNPFWVTLYSTGDIRAMLHAVGLEPVAIQGFGIEGAQETVHARLVERQQTLAERARRGEDVREAQRRLRADIQAIVQRDAVVGRRDPDRAHDIVVVAQKTPR